ncbi:MAG: hypothetical protein V1799_16745 [bacterium]
MDILTTVITILYYALVAYAVVLMVSNMLRDKSWEKEILCVIVILPFLLRLFRLK